MIFFPLSCEAHANNVLPRTKMIHLCTLFHDHQSLFLHKFFNHRIVVVALNLGDDQAVRVGKMYALIKLLVSVRLSSKPVYNESNILDLVLKQREINYAVVVSVLAVITNDEWVSLVADLNPEPLQHRLAKTVTFSVVDLHHLHCFLLVVECNTAVETSIKV